MNPTYKLSLLRALLLATAAGLPVGTVAQTPVAPPAAETAPAEASAMSDDGTQLNDIVVTARRRKENLQDVPLSVAAFSAETIANKGIRDISDVAKFTPGLFFDKGFVQQDVRPNIRGLPATRGRPPVGVLLDGIDISSESIASAGGGNLANLKLVDFERIEVVKGPQSALYGRVAFGGAINYISKEPGSDFEGYLAAEAATYDRYEARAAINVPVSSTLAVRVNGLYSYFDGFYDNEVTGKRIGGDRSIGGAIAAKFTPSDGIKLIARASYSDDKYEPRAQYYIGGAVGVGLRDIILSNAPGGLTTPIAATAGVARRGKIGKGIGTVNLSADPLTDKDFPGTHTKNFISSLRGEFDLTDDIMLSTWTGYVKAKGSQVQDADFFGRALTNYTVPATGQTVLAEVPPNATGLFFFDAKTTTEQFSQEVRIGRLSGSGFRWAVGALYWWENVDQLLASISVPTLAGNVYANIKLQGGRAPGQAQGRTTKHYSGYGLAEIDITDRLIVSAEGRYAKESYDYLFAKSIGTSSTANAQGIFPFVLLGATYEQGTSTTYFAPRVSVSYKPMDDLLVYASVSRGIKPAGLSQVQTSTPEDAAFGTEKLNNYEAGFKSTLFNRRLVFNGSIFRMDYKDKQESTLQPVPLTVNPQGQVSVIRNIGGARIDGAELEVTALLTRGLNLMLGYTFLDAKYTDFDIPQTSPITVGLAGGCRAQKDPDGITRCYVDLSGNRLEASSKHSLVASLNYRAPLAGDWNFLVESDFRYRSRRFQENTNQYFYAPYSVTDLRVGVETDTYSVIAYCNNLFDNRTVQSAQSSGDTQALPLGGLSLSSFAPDKRQFGIRARMTF